MKEIEIGTIKVPDHLAEYPISVHRMVNTDGSLRWVVWVGGSVKGIGVNADLSLAVSAATKRHRELCEGEVRRRALVVWVSPSLLPACL